MKLNRAILQVVLILALGLSELGCASAGSGGTPTTRRRMDVLTREEIATVDVGNLYDAVRRLRPRWLNVRGGSIGIGDQTIMVYQGQARIGDLSAMKAMSPDLAESLRFLDRSSAQAQLPGPWSAEMAGAIVIQTGQGR